MTQVPNGTKSAAQPAPAAALALAPVAGRLLASQAVAARGAMRPVVAKPGTAFAVRARDQASHALDQFANAVPVSGIAGLVATSAPQYLTIDEAATLARVTRAEIVRMIGAGELRAYRFGKSRKLISIASFLTALKPIRPGDAALEKS